MPAQISGLEIMDKDQLTEEVLDKFVNCHEQTYEEFLSTFTYISKDNVTRRGTFETDSSGNTFTSVKFPRRNVPNDHHLRNKAAFLCTPSQCSEEQIIMHEGQKVDSSFQGDLSQAGKVKVDNFLELEDLNMDEERKPQMSQDLLLLPGEVEQDVSLSVTSCFPSVDQLLTCEGKPRPTVKDADRQMEEIHGDEVQAFSLDEEFDYDKVMLTPKCTPAELDTRQEPSKPRRENTGAGLEEPCD
ncbi:intraflagellar transport-associated protein isoform X2 [Dasypus novemcinctus]|uniref:intraflagellar transport-associated protein isoform X2 n=1 Tax=Dasypus novemcinctus TaxID=9361 RepID=UPI00265DB82B|nr:intraflagellar transport-associated protein isoform X2 [Dasypus novemcinctus]